MSPPLEDRIRELCTQVLSAQNDLAADRFVPQLQVAIKEYVQGTRTRVAEVIRHTFRSDSDDQSGVTSANVASAAGNDEGKGRDTLGKGKANSAIRLHSQPFPEDRNCSVQNASLMPALRKRQNASTPLQERIGRY